mmetsp:Transcript_20634/g.26096  ORF Transcript_20634/g.26096 Transcript_20634/m.26096 type:complete len:238 (-) Transcript_20634:31-744(-)
MKAERCSFKASRELASTVPVGDAFSSSSIALSNTCPIVLLLFPFLIRAPALFKCEKIFTTISSSFSRLFCSSDSFNSEYSSCIKSSKESTSGDVTTRTFKDAAVTPSFPYFLRFGFGLVRREKDLDQLKFFMAESFCFVDIWLSLNSRNCSIRSKQLSIVSSTTSWMSVVNRVLTERSSILPFPNRGLETLPVDGERLCPRAGFINWFIRVFATPLVSSSTVKVGFAVFDLLLPKRG